MYKINKIKKELFFSYVTQFVTLLGWVFFLIFIPKYYWIDNFGILSLILSYITLFSFLFLNSVQEWVKKEITENRDINYKKINLYISNWIYLKLFWIIIFAPIIHLISYIFNISILLENINLYYILCWLMSWQWLLVNIFYALHKNIYVLYMTLFEYLIKILLIFYFFYLWFNSLEYILFSFIIWYLFSFIIWFFILFYKIKFKFNSLNIFISKELLKRYFWLSISSISFLLLTNIDNVMISYFYTNLELWYYNIATNIVYKSTIFTIAIVLAILPIFHIKQEKDILKNNFKKYLFWIVWLNTLLWISILLFAGFLINLIYWSWYDSSIQIMQIIFLFPLFAVLQTFFSWILTNFWNYKLLMFVSLWIALLNIVLNFILINAIWLIWVSIATIFSYFIWSLILGIIIKTRFINN